MGKVEKVIVLSVLFLVALILVVTITVDDPLDKTNLVEAGGKRVAPVVAQVPGAAAPTGMAPTGMSPTAPNPLLSATIQPPAPTQPSGAAPVVGAASTNSLVPAAGTNAAQPAASHVQAADVQPLAMASGPQLPPGALLKTMDGLQDSWFAELKLYTWREGDSWRKLADHYYGDWKRTDILKRSNEGRMDVEVGETVFVPVFENERAMQAAAQPTATKAAPVTPVAKSAAPANGKSVTKPAATTPTGKKMHTVANGESLWKIAKAELGDGNRWKEIYEANRDVLDKPESIKKGMRLRIP
jgi:nucleoid-associated protein YgaU